MTILTFIKAVFELALIVLLIIGYIHEDQVVEFERKLWNTFCGTVNSWIRKYEKRRTTHV